MPSSVASLLAPRLRHYRVKRGDSLWRIAEQQYGDPLVWPEIRRANHLIDAGALLVGMSLLLPDVDLEHLPTPGRTGTGAQRHEHPAFGDDRGRAVRHHRDFGLAGMLRGGLSPAKIVQLQGVTLKINRLVVVQRTPVYDVEMSYKGQITFQPEDSISTITLEKGKVSASLQGKNSSFSMDSSGKISGNLKTQYESDLATMGGQYHCDFNPSTHELDLSVGFSWGNKRVGSNQIEFRAPSTFIYKASPKNVQGEFNRTRYNGNISFELKLTLKSPDGTPPQAPAVQSSPFRVRIPTPSATTVTVAVLGVATVCGLILAPEITVPALVLAPAGM